MILRLLVIVLPVLLLACGRPLTESEQAFARSMLGDELAAQRVRLVDGAAGIARRIASLTGGQSFVRAHEDFAVATGDVDNLTTLAPILERHGLMRAMQF